MTPSGIEPATFRFVAHCLNQLRYRVPHSFSEGNINSTGEVTPVFYMNRLRSSQRLQKSSP